MENKVILKNLDALQSACKLSMLKAVLLNIVLMGITVTLNKLLGLSDDQTSTLNTVSLCMGALMIVLTIPLNILGKTLKFDISDVYIIQFYDDVYREEKLAVETEAELNRQGRKITIYEAMRYKRLKSQKG